MIRTEQIVDRLLRHNRLLLIGFLATLLGLAVGLPRVEVSTDSRAFFGANNQEYVELRRLDDTYTQPTTILLMLVPPEGEAFSPATLLALRRITDDAWHTPYVLRVDTAINHMHTYAEGDDILVEPMLDEFAEITEETAERFRTLALASDNLRNTLLAETGEAHGLTIQVVLPDDVPDARLEVEAFLAEMRAQWRVDLPSWEFRATGGLLGNNLLGRVAIQDITYLVPLALLAVVLLLTLAVGSIRIVAASVGVLICATLATYGFAGWLGVALTAGTAISPLAVMVLVSTSCVHISLSAIRAAENGNINGAFRHALEENIAPVTVSHLTTAFGFLCLNFAPSPPLADMGNIVAFGLVFGHAAVFVVLPSVLSRHIFTANGRLMISQTRMRRFAAWVIRNAKVFLLIFPVIGALAVVGISRIQYDDNVTRYFDDRYEFRQDADEIEARLTGLEVLQFSFAAQEGNSVFDPDYLRAVDRFVTWLDAQPNVVSVSALTDILKDVNQSMSGDDPAAAVIADTQAANAQLMMFYELSLPIGLDLNVLMDVDRTQSLVTANIRAGHSAIIRDRAQEAEDWLAANEPQLNSPASGASIAFARISQRNNSQMLGGFLVVLGLVSATMIVTLRSLRYGLLSLIPNLLPALLAFGFWGFFLGDVNLGSTVVTTMTFGIVVDDTVHFLMHYLRCRRRDLDARAALEETFSVSGSAILLTSVALIIGFVIMAASGFAINQHIGMLTAVVIFFALLSDLLLLPAVLVQFQERIK